MTGAPWSAWENSPTRPAYDRCPLCRGDDVEADADSAWCEDCCWHTTDPDQSAAVLRALGR